MSSNGPRLNPSKTELICFGSSRRLQLCPARKVRISDANIQPSESVISWRSHWQCNDADQICQPPHRRMLLPAPIRIIRRSLTTDAAHSLVRALIHAHVDYCNRLLISCQKYLIDKLQSISYAPAPLVLQRPYRSFVTNIMYRQLHWLDIQSRVQFKISLLVYKCLHVLAPQYLSDYCVSVPISSTRLTLRSAQLQERLLIVPRTRTKTIGPRGFFHASPALWNSLADDLHDPELSIGCFRNNWKLFSQV